LLLLLLVLLLLLACLHPDAHAQKLGTLGGGNTAMIIGLKGSVIAWGNNRYGTIGDSTQASLPPYSQDWPVPAHCGTGYRGAAYLGERSGGKVIALATGSGQQTLAVTEDGLVWGWGCPFNGQLGVGSADTLTGRTTPVNVLKGDYQGSEYLGDNPDNPVVAVATGGGHSLALTRNGTVLAWGRGSSGQLGTGSRGNRYLPARVLKGVYQGAAYLGDNPSNPIVAIAAGEDFSLALAQDGTLFSWGGNGSGRLGDGSVSIRLTPIRVRKGEYPGEVYLGDIPSDPITAISAGAHHAMALAKSGMVYCWGENVSGQLGNGSSGAGGAQIVPARVLKGSYNGITYLGENPSNPVIALAAGTAHSLALAEDGTMFAWGSNASGQIGRSSVLGIVATPVQVLRGEYSGASYLGDNYKNRVVQIAAGDHYSVAMTLDTRVYAWGDNSYGQLGDGSFLDQASPARVPVLAGISSDVQLPVQLSGFSASLQENAINLAWSTASEVNSYGFYLERAVENTDPGSEEWDVVGFVPGYGTTSQPHDYSVVDDAELIRKSERSIIVLYRLRFVDLDGAISYSDQLRLSLSPRVTVSTAVPRTRLAQNFPNPFQGATTIDYEIMERSNVLIELYDVTGTKISTLVDAQLPAGTHRVTIDTQDLRPGVYYYKMTAGNYIALRRMVLS
jgi:alpha-tubulin suppressor-like RCC1 family protein